MATRMTLLAGLTGSIILAIAGCDSSPAVETTNSRETQIVGGTAFSELPAIGAFTRGGNEWCTGTIISPRKVVTAAHCVLEDDGNLVNAGDLTFNIGTSVAATNKDIQKSIRVVSVHPHPGYVGESNDIAIAVLAADSLITPLTVVRSMDQTWVGKELLVVGFGQSSPDPNSNSDGAGIKRSITQKIVGVSATEYTFGKTGTGQCYGDSGGPAVFKASDGSYQVAGVDSRGGDENTGECTGEEVNTRVDAFLSFIDGISESGDSSVVVPDPGGTGTCEDPCADWGVINGQCFTDWEGSWYCEGTCLKQVNSCGNVSTPPGNNNGGSCDDPCADWGVTNGQCFTDSEGSWYCNGTCLSQVNHC